jgi:hypothetical protein
MIIIYDHDLKAVSRSRNLRGILRYPSPVERVDLWGAQLGVTWTDGASVITTFADPAVLRDWVRARRIFRGVPVTEHRDENIRPDRPRP